MRFYTIISIISILLIVCSCSSEYQKCKDGELYRCDTGTKLCSRVGYINSKITFKCFKDE